MQGLSTIAEAFRLQMMQILLQRRGIQLHPITTLYYTAPVCAVFLVAPCSYLEFSELMTVLTDPDEPSIGWMWVGLSAVLAFGLNLASIWFIRSSSALTIQIAGVGKNVLIILISMIALKSAVTSLQVIGYTIAVAAMLFYNYYEIQAKVKPVEVTQDQKLLVKQQKGYQLLPTTAAGAEAIATYPEEDKEGHHSDSTHKTNDRAPFGVQHTVVTMNDTQGGQRQ